MRAPLDKFVRNFTLLPEPSNGLGLLYACLTLSFVETHNQISPNWMCYEVRPLAKHLRMAGPTLRERLRECLNPFDTPGDTAARGW